MANTILLVDNDKSLTFSISNYLLNEGFIVHTANNVHNAIKILRTNKADLIISDILMPQKDGYAIIKYVKALDSSIHFHKCQRNDFR